MSLRVIFMGPPDFAVPTLTEIIGQGHEGVACYTRAPAQAGRGLDLRPGRRGRGFGHEPGCGSGPQGEAGTDSGGAPGCRVTVTGMPRRSSCWGSQTKMRAR